MDYLNIANSYVFYIVAVIIISFVVAQSVILLRMALKRSKVVGISKKQIYAAMRSSISVAILPSIATTIGFFTLAPILGIPIPWIRLSIIGGLSVELAAASIGATAAGVESFGANFTPLAFGQRSLGHDLCYHVALAGHCVILKESPRFCGKRTEQR